MKKLQKTKAKPSKKGSKLSSIGKNKMTSHRCGAKCNDSHSCRNRVAMTKFCYHHRA